MRMAQLSRSRLSWSNGQLTSTRSNLFTTQVELDPTAVLQFVPSKVTEDMNLSLNRPFLAEETEKAVPGPDGFTVGFYQTHWDLVGSSVTGAVLNFLNGGALVEGVTIPPLFSFQKQQTHRI